MRLGAALAFAVLAVVFEQGLGRSEVRGDVAEAFGGGVGGAARDWEAMGRRGRDAMRVASIERNWLKIRRHLMNLDEEARRWREKQGRAEKRRNASGYRIGWGSRDRGMGRGGRKDRMRDMDRRQERCGQACRVWREAFVKLAQQLVKGASALEFNNQNVAKNMNSRSKGNRKI